MPVDNRAPFDMPCPDVAAVIAEDMNVSNLLRMGVTISTPDKAGRPSVAEVLAAFGKLSESEKQAFLTAAVGLK